MVTPSIAYNSSSVLLTINGARFMNGCTITLTNESTLIPGNITSHSLTKITGMFALPGHKDGWYALTVTNPGGNSATKEGALNVKQPGIGPEISDWTPSSGDNTASLLISITGTNFEPKSTVSITNNTTTKTVSGVLNNNTLKCTLPLTGLQIGLYNLTVRNNDGSNNTKINAFLITNPVPVISSASPNFGYPTGSLQMTISGSKFVSGVQAALINGSRTIPAAISYFSATKCTCSFDLNGAQVGTYNLTVTNPGGQNAIKQDFFTVKTPKSTPTINTSTPEYGVNTGTVSILVNGTYFRAGIMVTITNQSACRTAAGTLISSDQIRSSLSLTDLPIGVYNLTVRNTDGTNATKPDSFTVINPTPTINSLSPIRAYSNGSATITIKGTKCVSGLTVALVHGSTVIPGTVSGLTSQGFTGTFILEGISEGICNLTVINPGVLPVTRQNCFTVVSQQEKTNDF